LASWVAEENGVEILKSQVRLRRVLRRSVGCKCECELELVNTRVVV
jgi:hypothetical protein